MARLAGLTTSWVTSPCLALGIVVVAWTHGGRAAAASVIFVNENELQVRYYERRYMSTETLQIVVNCSVWLTSLFSCNRSNSLRVHAYPFLPANSGAGMNLKVWKKFLSCPSTFLTTSTFSHFGERFRDGQYSLFSFLFCCSSTHGAPRAQPFLKSGGACPRALLSRRHCLRNHPNCITCSHDFHYLR